MSKITKIDKVNEEMETEELSWYVGVADCHGLDSFSKLNEEPDFEIQDALASLGLSLSNGAKIKKETENMLGFMAARARANVHRHAIMYKAKLSKEVAWTIEWTFRREGSEEALIKLKKHADTIQLARVGGIDAVKVWARIPNPALDPMR
jgi:hypothetical protein